MSQLTASQERTRTEVAAYLREFADKLDMDQTDDSTTEIMQHAESGSTTEREQEEVSSPPEAGSQETNEERQRPGTDSTETDRRWEEHRAEQDSMETGSRGEKMTLVVGNESTTINPPETLLFEVTVGTDSSLLGSSEERRARFELRWRGEDVAPNDELDIQ